MQGAAAMGDAGRGRENGDTRGLQSWLPEQQISLSGLERDHPSKYSHNSQGHSVALHKKALPESADVTVQLDLISMLTTYGYEHASTCVHARMDPRRHNPRILAILRFLAILMHTLGFVPSKEHAGLEPGTQTCARFCIHARHARTASRTDAM